MAKAAGQRLKMLYYRDILEKCTDADHSITRVELQNKLQNRMALPAPPDRKSVREDLEVLTDYFELEELGQLNTIRNPDNPNDVRFSLTHRPFELSDLKQLIDSVQTARYLSEGQTEYLKDMQHECKITVLETKCFPDLQERYLADPKSGPCPFFSVGDEFILKRTSRQDDFYHLMNGKFCGEAWDAVSRYVYTALQGGSIMKGWTNDDRIMIACCNDGTRPVIFKIERIDIPENDEEAEWLAKQDFSHSADDAYTG